MTSVADCTAHCKAASAARPERMARAGRIRRLANRFPSLRFRSLISLIFCATLALVFALPVTALAGPRTGAQSASSRTHLSAAELAREAEEALYSAEFSNAAVLYERAASLEPDDAYNWLGLANSRLLGILQASGRLDASLYSASTPLLEKSWPPPDAAKVRDWWTALERTRALCDERIRKNPADAEAWYIHSAGHGMEANYRLTIERKYFDALRAAGRTRDAARKALSLLPRLVDAKLLLGAYEFGIGSIPAAFRWMLFFGGHSGSKSKGIELLLEARSGGTRARAAAMSLLGVFYFRNEEFARSREMWLELQRTYPRNLRADLELARNYAKEGDTIDAASALTRALQQVHARRAAAQAHGREYSPATSGIEEDRLLFELAGLLESVGRREEALARYEELIALPGARGVLAAHAHVLAGDICRGLGRRERATQHYQAARALPFPEAQKLAAQRMKLLRR